MGFISCLGGRNIFMHDWKIWVNPYGKIDRGHHRHIIMDGILVLRIYADIGTIRLIRYKARLSYGLEFQIG